MKRIFACIVALVMCACVFAACSNDTPANGTVVSDLTAAKDYLYTMYKDATEATPADYTVVGVVMIGTVSFNVEWTVDSEFVKIVPGDNKMVTIDVDETNPEEISYNLTATVTDAEGNSESVSFFHRTPAAIIIEEDMSYADIVDIAYTLEDGLALDGTYRLYGTVTNIDTAWSEDYQNITVTIAVAGKEDKPIMCYRLAGEGAKNLAVGDAITVEGTFKNYKGTIEFDAGCALLGYGEVKDQSAILDAAYALEDGLALPDTYTLVGEIIKIDTAWSEDYKNITVTMVCGGDTERPMMCYRLAGEGAKDLAVGDIITVTGSIKNYKGTIEFDAGCALENVVKGSASEEPAEEVVVEAPSDPLEIVGAAYALEVGASLPYTATLTGAIVSVDTEYSADYQNVTVTIAVAGAEDMPIQCFRLKGEGADTIAVGDVITVTGTLKNYNGTIEFDSGCTLFVMPTEPAAVVEAAYALADGESLPQESTLTGVITSIDTEYSEQYGNITVTIEVEGKAIQCFRLKGEGAEALAVGDTITVTGTLKNYKGTIEFDAGCALG